MLVDSGCGVGFQVVPDTIPPPYQRNGPPVSNGVGLSTPCGILPRRQTLTTCEDAANLPLPGTRFMPSRRTRAAVDVLGSVKHLLLRLMPWIDEAWATHRDTGLRFRVRPRDAVGRTIMRRRAYEPEVTDWLLANLGKGSNGIFVDVGANLGWFTLQAARHERVQRVVAIEPDAVNHGLLQANINRESVARAGRRGAVCVGRVRGIGALAALQRLQPWPTFVAEGLRPWRIVGSD